MEYYLKNDFEFFLGCILRKRTSNWALDQMEKMLKESMRNHYKSINLHKKPLFWTNRMIIYWFTHSCTHPYYLVQCLIWTCYLTLLQLYLKTTCLK
jgi:hypothetical protein